MPSLILSDIVGDTVSRLRDNMPQSILLAGPSGVGLATIARYIAGKHLSGVITPTNTSGEPDATSAGAIRIDQIRDLISRTMGKSLDKRVYIIDDADKMRPEAQNAFLKLLEEPLTHVHFILTAHNDGALLPTIRSRTQLTRIPPVSSSQTDNLLNNLKVMDTTIRSRLKFLADGFPAEIIRLIENSDVFEAKSQAVAAARDFLQGSSTEKLQVVYDFADNRVNALEILTHAKRILDFSLAQNPSPDLLTRLKAVNDAYDHIAANAHVRTQLLNIVVQ